MLVPQKRTVCILQQQLGGSPWSTSSRPSRSKLLSTEKFLWDGTELHARRDPAAPSLGKDGDHLSLQTLPVDHRSENTTTTPTQGQTLSLHSLERIPAISTTAISLPAISRGFSARLLDAAECRLDTPHERVISNIFSPCCCVPR